MRLDIYLVEQGLCQSRDRAKALIESGDCMVNGRTIMKPAYRLLEQDDVVLKKPDFSYVSRGGLKLEAALEAFQLNVQDLVALDVGVATGGFTDCLLQKGVSRVYAVDVGKGQLVDKLQQDERVIFMPGHDARKLLKSDFPESLELVVVDVSFISVTTMLGALKNVGQSNTDYVFLIKPQFETGKPHSGVLRNMKVVNETLKNVQEAFEQEGYDILKMLESPIRGKEGNREFLWHVRWR